MIEETDMTKLNVIYSNHLDLTWRRPRYTAGVKGEYRIAPYAEVQERQMDAAMDFMRRGGCYDIEQTTSIREYIERNPDSAEEIASLIADGRLRLLGGGESVIDYNLPDGESILRNHVYSRLYMKRTFGCAPTLAMCPDTFGLSAGLPTLFRALGYRGMLSYHRVFQGAKPVWRGISGDRILLESIGVPNAVGIVSFNKCRVCGICGGAGCPACEGAGFVAERAPAHADHMESMISNIREQAKAGDVTFTIYGEECTPPAGVMDGLKKIAEACSLELRFMSAETLAHELYENALASVDEMGEDLIDERCEGNPTAAGCYTSRIRLKQENRRCEAALRAAERLSTLAAALKGEVYPKAAFERLWRKVAFMQFHDALPASHSDDAYGELMEVGRQIRASAAREIVRAGGKLTESIGVKEKDSFILLNPLEFDVKGARLTGVVHIDDDVCGGSVIAPDGSRHEVVSITHSVSPESSAATVEFFGDLPAFGYGVFRFLPTEEVEQPRLMKHGFVMENDALRVEFGKFSVLSILDKKKGVVVAGEGSFSPILSDDAGHPWGRNGDAYYHDRADRADFVENMMPPEKLVREVSYCRRGDLQIAVLHVEYTRTEKQIQNLTWNCELILPDGDDELKMRVRTSFDARDIKLSLGLHLPKAPKGGKLDYEVPLGRIARGAALDLNSQVGNSDEWPALRYVSADLGEQNVTLCNSGTPAHKLSGFGCNEMECALLRTPTQQGCGYGFEGAIDRGEHVFDFTFAAGDDELSAYRRGMTLNSSFPVVTPSVSSGTDSSVADCAREGSFIKLPNDLPLMALKGAEDGEGFVCRYLGLSEERTLHFEGEVAPLSVLEEEDGIPTREVCVKPFGIRTLHVSGDRLKKQ